MLFRSSSSINQLFSRCVSPPLFGTLFLIRSLGLCAVCFVICIIAYAYSQYRNAMHFSIQNGCIRFFCIELAWCVCLLFGFMHYMHHLLCNYETNNHLQFDYHVWNYEIVISHYQVSKQLNSAFLSLLRLLLYAFFLLLLLSLALWLWRSIYFI